MSAIAVPTTPPPLDRLVGRATATVPQLFRARAAASPERTFLSWEGRQWTYERALDEARRFSGWLLATSRSDPASDRRVASFLPNSAEAVWTWFGSLLAGATYVPLNRAHRGELLLEMLKRSGAGVLVADHAAVDVLPDLAATSIRTLLVVGGPGDLRAPAVSVSTWDDVRQATPADGPERSPADPAVVMYTSGTTGRSKAVLMPHTQFCRGAGWVAWSLDMSEDDVIHAWMPLYHVAGQLDQTLPVLIAGGQVALYPTFSRSRFWSQVHARHATIFIGFSNVLELLWTLPRRREDAQTTLRAGIMGGVPRTLHRAFERRFAVDLKDVYGMTEGEPMVLPAPGEPPPVGSAGRPTPDFEVAILRDDDSIAAPGEPGEIAVRPRFPGVMFAGYEHDAPATLATLRSLWFHTGDLGRIDSEGFVYFIDRKKHAIRRRGENISSFELESIVLRHPDVDQCTAVGVIAPMGEEDVKLIVTVVAGRRLEPAPLHAWCRERMAAFMIPRFIEVVDELPRTPTGKVLKQGLGRHGPATWDADAARAPDTTTNGRRHAR